MLADQFEDCDNIYLLKTNKLDIPLYEINIMTLILPHKGGFLLNKSHINRQRHDVNFSVNSLLVWWFGKQPALFPTNSYMIEERTLESGGIQFELINSISLPFRVITAFSFLSFLTAFSEESISSARCVRVTLVRLF